MTPEKFFSALCLITAIAISLTLLTTSSPGAAADPGELAPELVDAARAASKIAGVALPSLLAQLAHESAFRADARNAASTASGPAQFLEATWLEMIQRHGAAYGLASAAGQIVTINGRLDIADAKLKAKVLGLRQDPHLAVAMAGRYLAAVADDLGRLLGRAPSELEIRVGYLFGAGGAAQLVKAARATPKASAAEILPDAAKANPTLFRDSAGRTLGAADCLASIRTVLSQDAARAGRVDPEPVPETLIDPVLAPADAG
jgi:hypothetical protein